ncbi:hypothetical protein AGMMS50212_16720 [Spirochaetia bacterium]|nr:hypothetical protein AGMMS50212_16720 [Spirochaetia bacterium]
MQAVKAYYDGRAFVPTMPVSVKTNRTAIVTILDDEIIEPAGKQSKKTMNGNADWIGGHFKVESFEPLKRDEIYDR